MTTVSTADESGYDRDTLSDAEKERLDRTLERSVEDTRSEGVPTLQEKIKEYSAEIEFAAEVAKAQFDTRFDGQNPRSNYFGITQIRPGYFGYDSWHNTPSVSDDDAPEVVYFIDDGEPDNLEGDGGRDNPLRVGEDLVHVVLGVGTLEDDCPVSAVQFHKNDNPRSAFSTQRPFTTTDLNVKWLDAPIVMAEDDDIVGRAYAGTGGDTALYLEGFTFIKEKASRVLEPSDMAEQDFVKSLS